MTGHHVEIIIVIWLLVNTAMIIISQFIKNRTFEKIQFVTLFSFPIFFEFIYFGLIKIK
jgi:hypothetical protein